MKILYAIQGTGNGHVSRARDIIPELQRYGQVDVLLSGYQVDMDLPFPVKYRLKGLSFIFGKKGGVSVLKTIKKLRPFRFLQDVFSLPVHKYDLIVNDFEPVAAWACRWSGVPCISLSHQAAVLHPAAPKPGVNGWVGRLILNHYAPCDDYYGFHFERYGSNVFTPVVRKQIMQLPVADNGHYTVYLPAYDDDKLLSILSRVPHAKWQVFSKHNKAAITQGNVSIVPVSNDAFVNSLATCTGALLGAGFEGPSEALWLKKKLMVVPMTAQYEQQCNAAALESLGVPVLQHLDSKSVETIKNWIAHESNVQLSFSSTAAADAVAMMMDAHLQRVMQQESGLSAI